MSEVIAQPGSQTGSQFGLKIISSQPVRVNRTTAAEPIVVLGSSANDTIEVINPNSAVRYQFQGSGGRDSLVGASGADAVYGDAANDTISGGGGNDLIQGGAGNDRGLGGLGVDRVMGGAGNDTLFGGSGNDILMGDAGNDQLFGDAGNDSLNGGAGNDTLAGGAGNDTLVGGAGNDSLNGGAGNDSLDGGAGNDILTPGTGQDTMQGGTGKDRFRFEDGSVTSNRLDTIKDFKPGQDTLEISRELLPGSGLKTGKLSRGEFDVVRGITSANTDAKIVYDASSGIVYYNPSEGTNVPLFQLQKNLNLGSSSFKLF